MSNLSKEFAGNRYTQTTAVTVKLTNIDPMVGNGRINSLKLPVRDLVYFPFLV
ncbi:hypothetical protein [Sessilibacter corallicola]|uniref:hypothetical protein n=1 Tax=Sessilibacter corallicola TaxID=2904075 RepID=UPI001E2A2553|nr:hypothetical protein [Sessilibacter corallicola]MCE2027847.1 hypothetical protein [Sessilibacter corallicola]